MSSISIVIPTRRPSDCTALIAQLHAYGHHDIVVVHPATAPTITAQATYIATTTLVSAAQARNLGIQASQGAIICFLDDDIRLGSDVPRWLAYALQDPHIGMVGALLVDAPTDGYWRRCMHRIMAAAQHTQQHRYIPTMLLSMAVALRRTDVIAIGGFDEGFVGAAGEDSELSLRMGYQLTPYVLPQARISHHPHPDGWWAATQRIWRYGAQWPAVLRRHPRQSSPLQRARWWVAPGIAGMAPLLAIIDMRRYWRTPAYGIGCGWLRMAWYMGVANAIWHQHD